MKKTNDEVRIVTNKHASKFNGNDLYRVLIVDPLSIFLRYYIENSNGDGVWFSETDIIADIDIYKIDNIDMDGVDTKDYPDFSDAFISAADHDGEEMTEEELIWVQDNYPDFVHEEVNNYLY